MAVMPRRETRLPNPAPATASSVPVLSVLGRVAGAHDQVLPAIAAAALGQHTMGELAAPVDDRVATAPIEECTESMPAAVGTSAASRVIARARSTIVAPLPPNASGTASPHRPISPSAASAAIENLPRTAGGGSSSGAAAAGSPGGWS